MVFSDDRNYISHHAVICYLGLKDLAPKEIHKDMAVILGEDAPPYNMVKWWAAEFIHGKESLEGDPCLERSVTVTRLETIAKIHDIIMADGRVMERYIATELGIRYTGTHPCSHP